MCLIIHLSPLFRFLKLLTSQRRYFQTFKEPRNRLQGIDSKSLCSLAGRYDNHIPTRFPAPIDYSKIPAQGSRKEAWTISQWAMLRVENLSPAMGRGIDSRSRVWNWVAKLHTLAGRYDNPMPTWFLAPIAGLKLPTLGSREESVQFYTEFQGGSLYYNCTVKAQSKISTFRGNPFHTRNPGGGGRLVNLLNCVAQRPYIYID
jgi:hypothetical protein